MKRATKKMRKIVFNNLDSLYDASKKICDSWDLKTIPITELAKMTDLLTSQDIEIDYPELKNFQAAYNNMFSTIFKTCKEKAKEMQSKGVSVEYLKKCIEVVKENFDKKIK